MGFKKFALALVLAPTLAIAAPAKKSVAPQSAAPTSGGDTLMGSAAGSMGAGLPEAIRGNLSVGASLDFADSFDRSGAASGKAESEKALTLIGQYEFDQFSPGISGQVGGTYDFSRDIKNFDTKIQEWTVFGEVVGKMTPAFKLFGGLNYNFPNQTNLAQGASIKGKIGYQFGASYQFAPNFAVDGRYRQLEMEQSFSNGQGGTATVTGKLSGFMLGGRYIF